MIEPFDHVISAESIDENLERSYASTMWEVGGITSKD